MYYFLKQLVGNFGKRKKKKKKEKKVNSETGLKQLHLQLLLLTF